MENESQQANLASNSQAFSMFFEIADVADKRGVSRRQKKSAPT